MPDNIILKGITWGHSRGYTPLVACAQRFSELYPHIQITWNKRSLQAFADYPIEKLVYDYDLLIIDHPWVGCAAATQCVLPLNQHLPAEYLQDQLKNTVGASHNSYYYKDSQWALAIDAATPIASYRKDLLEQHHVTVPDTWQEVIALAAKGKVAVPAIPIDLLMNFYMFCIAAGKQPFENKEEVTDNETGLKALHTMKELWGLVDKKMFNCNPIAVAEIMTSTDDYWYCPFAYGYSNYSREGYSNALLHYTDLVHIEGQPLKSTLGGTGLAISAFTQHKNEAVQFTEWIVSQNVQAHLYTQAGGQPGHLAAWVNEANNRNTHDYFSETLPALQRAYVRPRYNGYLHFQDHAGHPLQEYLGGTKKAMDVLNEINQLYRSSFKG